MESLALIKDNSAMKARSRQTFPLLRIVSRPREEVVLRILKLQKVKTRLKEEAGSQGICLKNTLHPNPISPTEALSYHSVIL